MSDFQSVLTAACSLPDDDKLRLIDVLASLVADDKPPTLLDDWLNEIERRASELDTGNVLAASWDSVRESIRKSVGLDK